MKCCAQYLYYVKSSIHFTKCAILTGVAVISLEIMRNLGRERDACKSLLSVITGLDSPGLSL